LLGFGADADAHIGLHAAFLRFRTQLYGVAHTVKLGSEAQERGVQAYVGISVSPKAQQQVIKRLSRLPELRQLASVSGEFDYMALLRAQTTMRLDALLDEIGEIEGVIKTTTSVVLALKLDRSA